MEFIVNNGIYSKIDSKMEQKREKQQNPKSGYYCGK